MRLTWTIHRWREFKFIILPPSVRALYIRPKRLSGAYLHNPARHCLKTSQVDGWQWEVQSIKFMILPFYVQSITHFSIYIVFCLLHSPRIVWYMTEISWQWREVLGARLIAVLCLFETSLPFIKNILRRLQCSLKPLSVERWRRGKVQSRWFITLSCLLTELLPN